MIRRSAAPLMWGLALLVAATSACSSGAGSDEPRVVAALYPLEFVANQVAGPNARVDGLTPAGTEPHDLELTPSAVRSLAEADLVVYLGAGFQPAVEDALAEVDTRAVDVLRPAPPNDGAGGADPHVWLDPERLGEIAAIVSSQLAEVDPAGAKAYEANAEELSTALDRLDRDMAEALRNCERRHLVVAHEAFGFLADRYDLQQVGVSGIDPESEPSPQRLAEVARLVEDNGVSTVFFERGVPDAAATTIARETGVETAELDPLEFTPENGRDYFDVMRRNATAIGRALGCS